MGPGIIDVQLMYKYIMGPDNISIYYIHDYYRAHPLKVCTLYII
jgi:hypothetical protein